MRVLDGRELYRFYHQGDQETFALRGISLSVERGETVAVLGPSGSGKSTLIACLAGLDEPDGGTVDLLGRRLTRRPEAERCRLRACHCGILMQFGNLFDHLTVEANVRLQMQLARKVDFRRLDQLLDALGLTQRRGVLPSTLSGGELARAGLAVALATDPPLVLADEPTAEVDSETEERILALLDARRATGGAAIIATHSIAVARHANRVTQIRDGKLSNE